MVSLITLGNSFHWFNKYHSHKESIVLLMKKVHVLLTLNFLTLDLVDQLHEKKITGSCSTYSNRIYETTLFLSWRRLANNKIFRAYYMYNERETNSLLFSIKIFFWLISWWRSSMIETGIMIVKTSIPRSFLALCINFQCCRIVCFVGF